MERLKSILKDCLKDLMDLDRIRIVEEDRDIGWFSQGSFTRCDMLW